MYATLDEVYENCPEELVTLINDVISDDSIDSFDESNYAAIALYMTSWNSWNKNKVLESLDKNDGIDKYYIQDCPKEYSREYFETLNSILHIEHLKHPELRDLAVKNIAFFKDRCDLYPGKYSEYLTLKAPEFLTGKDAVPEYMVNEIMEIVKPYAGDISLDIRTSWIYSHHDMGENYGYEISECVDVEVRSITKEALNLACNAINKHEFGVGRSVNDLCDAIKNNDIQRVKENLNNGIGIHGYSVDDNRRAGASPYSLAKEIHNHEILSLFKEKEEEIRTAELERDKKEVEDGKGKTFSVSVKSDVYHEGIFDEMLKSFNCFYDIAVQQDELNDSYIATITVGEDSKIANNQYEVINRAETANLASRKHIEESVNAYCNDAKVAFKKYLQEYPAQTGAIMKLMMDGYDNGYKASILLKSDMSDYYTRPMKIVSEFPDLEKKGIERKEEIVKSIYEQSCEISGKEEVGSLYEHAKDFLEYIKENPEEESHEVSMLTARNKVLDAWEEMKEALDENESYPNLSTIASCCISDVAYELYTDDSDTIDKQNEMDEIFEDAYDNDEEYDNPAKQCFHEIVNLFELVDYMPEEFMSEIQMGEAEEEMEEQDFGDYDDIDL